MGKKVGNCSGFTPLGPRFIRRIEAHHQAEVCGSAENSRHVRTHQRPADNLKRPARIGLTRADKCHTAEFNHGAAGQFIKTGRRFFNLFTGAKKEGVSASTAKLVAILSPELNR